MYVCIVTQFDPDWHWGKPDGILQAADARGILPYFAQGWEEQFINANTMEQAVYCIEKTTIATNEKREMWKEKNKHSILTIPFEKFVLDPWPYLKEIEEKLETKIGSRTNKMMRKQNVPRSKFADGIPFKVHKRCGWDPPVNGFTERDELNK